MQIRRLAVLFTSLAHIAPAVVLTLGSSTQIVTLTGTGVNAAGAGTTRVGWGACTFDGATTTCIVSGSYTGLGSGGTYKFTLAYPGNGASPLSAIASPPGSNLVTFNLTAGSFTFTATPSGGTPIQFYDLRWNFDFSPLTFTCTGVSSCAVGAVGTTSGATISGPIIGTFDVTPVVNAVLTNANYGGFTAIAPATWIEIYGLNLATTLNRTWGGGDFTGTQAPQSLGGTSVTVGGKPAYVEYVSPHQLDAQVPSGIATGSQPVVVTTAGGPSLTTNVTVNAVEPGLLAPAVFKLPAGQYAVALFPDGSTYVLPPGVTNAVPTARAKPGDTIVLYGIGFGPVSPDIPAGTIVQQANSLSGFQAAIGGVPTTVQFAGLVSGFLGLYQFNVVVPQVPANDATPLTFTFGNAAGAQTLLLPIGK